MLLRPSATGRFCGAEIFRCIAAKKTGGGAICCGKMRQPEALGAAVPGGVMISFANASGRATLGALMTPIRNMSDRPILADAACRTCAT